VLRPDDRVVQGLEDVRRHFVVLLALCEELESRMMPCKNSMKNVPYIIVFENKPSPETQGESHDCGVILSSTTRRADPYGPRVGGRQHV